MPTLHQKLVSVFGLRARVSDKQAINALLEPVPDGNLLRRRLKHAFTAQHWDPEFGIDYWIVCNGTTALRLWIEGLNVNEARRTREVFADRTRRAGGRGRVEWLEEILRAVTNSPSTLH
jgi:hypothetical protein